ncbi:MAG: hypothetical protein NVS1B1_08430 [Candidatus Limnocylindrales bacterium]
MVLGVRSLRVGAVAIGLAFVLAIVLGLTGVLTPTAQRTAAGASTTLTIISGTVGVRSTGHDFGTAADGAILVVGDTVRTGPDGRAVLTYFEGTTVEIEPSSEITIDAASATSDGSTVLLMTQNIGRTWHVVTHLLSGNSKYEVRTPASTASVRGTQFEVAVTSEATTVTTSQGRVATSDPAQLTEVLVTPGLTTTTRKGERPTPPVPAPQPDRRVVVTVGHPDAVVVDPFGRANGFKDGKLVLQTPGASARIDDGKLVVVLPNMADGLLSARVQKKDGGETDVETVVEDRGVAPVTMHSKATGRRPAAVTVHHPDGRPAELHPVGSRPRKSAEVPVPLAGPGENTQPDHERPASSPHTVAPTAGGAHPRIAHTPKPSRSPKPIRTPHPTTAADQGAARDHRGTITGEVGTGVTAPLAAGSEASRPLGSSRPSAARPGRP